MLLIVIGSLVFLLVAYRLLDQPGPNSAIDVRLGAYLGLASLGLVTAGGWRSLADEHATTPAVRDVSSRPAPPAGAPSPTRDARPS